MYWTQIINHYKIHNFLKCRQKTEVIIKETLLNSKLKLHLPCHKSKLESTEQQTFLFQRHLLIIHVKSNSTIINGTFKTDLRNRERHHIFKVTTQAYNNYTEQDKLTNHHRSKWSELIITRQACLHDCKSIVKRQKNERK